MNMNMCMRIYGVMALGSFLKFRYDHYRTRLHHARIVYPEGSNEDDFAYMDSGDPRDVLLEAFGSLVCPLIGLLMFTRDLVLFANPRKQVFDE